MKTLANRYWKDIFQLSEEERREGRLSFPVMGRYERFQAEHYEAARNYFRDNYLTKPQIQLTN